MNLQNGLQVINGKIAGFTKNLMTLILFIVLGVMAINVVTRYLFNYSFSWAEEIGSLGLVWLVFLGGGMVARKGNHLSIDTLYLIVPAKIRVLIDILIIIGTVIITIVLIRASSNQVSSLYLNYQVLTASKIPLYVAYLVMPIGFFLILMGSLEFFLNKYFEKKK